MKCHHCPFDEDEIEKDCALNATLAVEKECTRSDACVVQIGYSKTDLGTKRVEYRKCGRLEANVDEENCKNETLDTLSITTCFCQDDLCNGPSKYIHFLIRCVAHPA